MAEGLNVGANDGDISVAFINENVELKVLALACSTFVSVSSMPIVVFNDNVELTVSVVTCTTLSSCMSTCLLLSLAGISSELTSVAEAKKRAEVAKSFAAVKKEDGRFFMVVLLYG